MRSGFLSVRHSLMIVLFGLISLCCISEISAETGRVVLHLKGVSCPFCVYGVEKRLKKVPGIQEVKTDYKAATSTVSKNPKAAIDLQALEEAVRQAGFTMDRIDLSMRGSPTVWEGKPALKDPESGQVFLLVEPDKDHVHELLDPKKWSEIQRETNVEVQGEAHPHVGSPPAIAVRKYKRMP
ncbi:MAG: cation transporter [Deltaproteobacteria bacterium]|nr:cation transporter [Deltaproteobacteria bacterium]